MLKKKVFYNKSYFQKSLIKSKKGKNTFRIKVFLPFFDFIARTKSGKDIAYGKDRVLTGGNIAFGLLELLEEKLKCKYKHF